MRKKIYIFSLRLDDELRDALTQLAYHRRSSRGQFVRTLLYREALQQNIISPPKYSIPGNSNHNKSHLETK